MFRIYSIVFIFIPQLLSGQNSDYPKDFLKPEFHKIRREALREKMPDNSVAVFFANPKRNRSNDVDYIYHQDPNFYYLTGYREAGSLLLVFKEVQSSRKLGNFNEILFSQAEKFRNATYDGPVLGVDGVKRLGFDKVFEATKFKDLQIDFATFDHVLFFDFFNDVRDDPNNPADLFNLIEVFKNKTVLPARSKIEKEKDKRNNLNTKLLPVLMAELREIKTDEEVKLLRKAIDISCIGQIEVMKAMHPDMSEAEVQGIHEFVYKKYGAEHEGYPSIVGAGHNGCTLHYIKNDKMKIRNDLVLMDLGAEYHGYTADVTRTIPADGHFSAEERAIYEIVLEAQEEAFKYCKPGNSIMAANAHCQRIITNGLMKLGILKSAENVRDYLPHGVTHHIGLDVHDPGLYNEYRPNMVLTIEPGIYIPHESNCPKKWWGIAIRIEDDILITQTGYELLSDKAPRTVDEIEAMMAEDNIFSEYQLPVLNEE